MLLRKLDAYGFKSFADKTEVEFGTGITAVVGPNGSGKSNISDAIRWALGEQNVRNLRGTKMEDVIFAGSSSRRPLGVAEVSLTFDNSDGSLPLDFNEVIITRRVFRSGESEYYINKTPARLKDIQDLMAEGGIGRESMTVIGQNKIDEVLNSKPDERRLLFEDAAGIAKYKNRKQEALRKLEDTEHNLMRVGDIAAEIETQLEPLFESAERCRRYNELDGQLKSAQITLLLDKMDNAEKMCQSAKLQISNLSEAELTTSSKLSVIEVEKERVGDTLARLTESASSLEESVKQAEIEIERIDGKIGVLNERIASTARAQERLNSEITKIEAEKMENQNRLTDFEHTLELKNGQRAELANTLGLAQVQYKELVKDIETKTKQIAEGQELSFSRLQETVSQKNTIKIIERDIEQLELRYKASEKEYEDFSRQLEAVIKTLQEIEQERKTLETSWQIRAKEAAAVAEEKQAAESDLEFALNRSAKIERELSDLTSRLNLLACMQQDYEGFGRAVKAVLASNAPWRKAVCGAVAEIIRVPDRFVTAVETGLGGALQHIITETDTVAKQCVEYLKKNNLGRATFLPLNALNPAPPRDFERRAAIAPGSLGFASELVNVNNQFKVVVSHLLGRTIVAEDLEAALCISKQYNFSIRIVTLEGELITPGGAITGGSKGRRETGFLARNNEIEQIKASCANAERDLQQSKQAVMNARLRVAEAETRLKAFAKERQDRQVRLAELSVLADKTQADFQRTTLAVNTIKAELQSFNNEKAQLEEQLQTAKTKVIALETSDTDHKSNLTVWQSELRQLEQVKEESQNKIAELKISLGGLEQEIAVLSQNCLQKRKDITNYQEQLQTLRTELLQCQAQLASASSDLTENTAIRLKAAGRKNLLEQDLYKIQNDKIDIYAYQQKLEKEIKDLRRKQNDLQSRLHEMQLLETKYEYEISRCNEELRERYGLSSEKAKAMIIPGTREHLTAEIVRIEQEISLLGPVNHSAIQEYARIKERHSFLINQMNDLEEAKEYLTSLIKEMDETMTRQFKLAYNAINAYFSEIFIKLFNGGDAKLLLTDSGDILNSGIEILVQPPGKKQQNLALLSGGERALTVIALLFAFLTYRPAPFCVVDEIDAALDEANVRRFSEFLHEYADKTQFIVVTHRKATMEAAKVMHGVTMEESGVSKLISVKFMDKAV